MKAREICKYCRKRKATFSEKKKICRACYQEAWVIGTCEKCKDEYLHISTINFWCRACEEESEKNLGYCKLCENLGYIHFGEINKNGECKECEEIVRKVEFLE